MESHTQSPRGSTYQDEEWYIDLEHEGKHICELIFKYHRYFSSKDKQYRNIVRRLKISVLLLAMMSTITLGLKKVMDVDLQVNIGLILSAVTTFITALSSYFNFEEYWMRNIAIHIELNILRDNFLFEAKAKKINKKRMRYYKRELETIQDKNIHYWESVISKINKI